ncbi:hypothetical protein HAX54_027605 [Datura stramonium]|uniref:FLZ-type domain-containing protein n=1 Tax=Datura stramonium TaxID=4076 RepID=A0ABS8V4W2_DATST|nr:hypothetical protein [Datura stramonium]
MSKRSRVSRSDSFDQPNYPHKTSSGDNPNKFARPGAASAISYNSPPPPPPPPSVPVSSSFVEMTSDLFKECYFCKSDFKPENDIYMYRSNAFCKKECREIQMDFDEELMKKQMEISGKKMDN